MPDGCALLPSFAIVLALPILLHAPELLGLVSSDPLPLISGQGYDFPHALLPGQPGWIDGNAGATTQALGRLVARDWLHGIVPWWNPYSGVGVPLAGEYQPAAFFLPFVLLLALPNGVLLLKLALQLIAGAAMLSFARRLGWHRSTAVVAAVLWELNGTFATASDAPIQPIAFLPVMLLGIERAIAAGRRRQGFRHGWFVFGLGLGVSLLAGFPETAFLDALLALAWAAARAVQDPRAAPVLALRLAIGSLWGLLLAAPQLVAFLDYLPDAYVGAHAGTIDIVMPAAGAVMWLMPWLNGPIFFGLSDPAISTPWFLLGGFLGAAPVLLATIGLFGARDRAPRLALGVVVLLLLGRSIGIPAVSGLAGALPLLGHALVCRYSLPVVSCAVVLLAAFALDDWRRGALPARRVALCSGAFALLVVVCLWLAHPNGLQVSRTPLGLWMHGGSIVLLLLISVPLALLLLRPATPRTGRLAAALVLAESVLLFCLPLLSAAKRAPVDLATVAALRADLGLHRFATLGTPMVPNYGAFWGIASIQYNMVPAPARWVRFVQARIDADTDPMAFYGQDDPSAAGLRRREIALAAHLKTLRELGVRDLAMGSDCRCLEPEAVSPIGREDAGWVAFDGGARRSWRYEVDPALNLPPLVTTAGIKIGTFVGVSNGPLRLTLCTPRACAAGQAPLDGAVDNAVLPVRLDHGLALRSGDALTLTLAHPSGRVVALYLWTRSDAEPRPQLHLEPPGGLERVANEPTAVLDRLPGAAPYMEAPGCRLEVKDRERARFACAAPAVLLRRELFMRGWTARVAGTPSLVRPAGPLFQQVALPAGRGTVRFRYAPPHAMFGWVGWMLAALMLLATWLPGRPVVSKNRRA